MKVRKGDDLMGKVKFIESDIKEFNCNPFDKIGNEWMLITAEKEGKTNTMTASWGGLGVIWNYNVAYIFVRQSRFTKEFLDESDTFSLSFFNLSQYRETMTYLGSVSGRNEDKIANAGLTIKKDEHTPYFEEAETVLICRKLARQYINPESIIDEEIFPDWYADLDYHDMYIGEIKKVLKKD